MLDCSGCHADLRGTLFMLTEVDSECPGVLGVYGCLRLSQVDFGCLRLISVVFPVVSDSFRVSGFHSAF